MSGTMARTMARTMGGAILAATLPALSAAALQTDPEGKPNEDGQEVCDRLASGSMAPKDIYEYFAHYSPVIRVRASHAMLAKDEGADPFIIRGLKSKDKRVVRASCDAISGFGGWAADRMKKRPAPTPERAAMVVPHLVPLLEHEALYVRDGALLALSRCGKKAAPHLPRVAEFLSDEEWWLREGAAMVLAGVGSPEADRYAVRLARTLLGERHIMCLNSMSRSLKSLMTTAAASKEVALVIGKGLAGMERAYIRQRGRDVLDGMGTKAKEALPHVDRLIEEEKRYIEKATADGTLGRWDQWDLDNLRKTREKISGQKAEKP